jgi:hypothetical protein
MYRMVDDIDRIPNTQAGLIQKLFHRLLVFEEIPFISDENFFIRVIDLHDLAGFHKIPSWNKTGGPHGREEKQEHETQYGNIRHGFLHMRWFLRSNSAHSRSRDEHEMVWIQPFYCAVRISVQ